MQEWVRKNCKFAAGPEAVQEPAQAVQEPAQEAQEPAQVQRSAGERDLETEVRENPLGLRKLLEERFVGEEIPYTDEDILKIEKEIARGGDKTLYDKALNVAANILTLFEDRSIRNTKWLAISAVKGIVGTIQNQNQEEAEEETRKYVRKKLWKEPGEKIEQGISSGNPSAVMERGLADPEKKDWWQFWKSDQPDLRPIIANEYRDNLQLIPSREWLWAYTDRHTEAIFQKTILKTIRDIAIKYKSMDRNKIAEIAASIIYEVNKHNKENFENLLDPASGGPGFPAKAVSKEWILVMVNRALLGMKQPGFFNKDYFSGVYARNWVNRNCKFAGRRIIFYLPEDLRQDPLTAEATLPRPSSS
jgi:hypothetical protein